MLEAPPGAGKSTRVPPALLDAGLAEEGQIVMLEPRRVAARATARRIAAERGGKLGGEVGYQVRHDRRVGPQTRLVVMTEAILTRKLQGDPLLDGVEVVILDEVHERGIHTDLALAFLREVREVREDLKVVVMSATLDASPMAEFLGLPVVRSEGRQFEVTVEHLDRPAEDALEVEAARAVRRWVGSPDDDGGDALVFLPGRREIHRCIGALQEWARGEDIEVLPLYSALSGKEQDRALASGGRRKVIASTNIAETSVTIEGVTLVVDSGKVRQVHMAPESRLNHLELRQISLASARQRAGRAGRVRPGRAIRLWTTAREHRMEEYDRPEIGRVEIAGALLEVIAWSGMDPEEFRWFEAPPTVAIRRGVELLERLGAVADGQVTEVGRELLGMPLHPRLGRMLLAARELGVVDEVAAAAAVLSEGDFVTSVAADAPTGRSDLLVRGALLDEVAAGREVGARALGLSVHVGRARGVQRARAELMKRVADVESGGDGEAREDRALKAVLVGFPDRVALRRTLGEDRFVMVGGEPMLLARESVVRDARWIVAPRVGGKVRGGRVRGDSVSSRNLIRLASEVELPWLEELFPEALTEEIQVGFDGSRQRVMARRVKSFEGIAFEEEVLSVEAEAEPEEVLRELKGPALSDLSTAFGLSDEDSQWLLRWEWCRRWFPEAEFPQLLADEAVGNDEEPIWDQLLWGKRSFGDLRRMGVVGALKAYLNAEQRRLLAEEAPERITVPSGSAIRLRYEWEGPPVLAVRIQELFGWTDTPRVGRGEVGVLMHLLAPNYRPAQITDDLGGFWERTYPEVRKELRARYPKHPWPEDPVGARAVRK